MADMKHTLFKEDGSPLPVTIRRDKRLKKSARWTLTPDGGVLVRIPARLPKTRVPALLRSIQHQLSQPRRRAKRRTDADLQARAVQLNQTCFENKVRWESIRWVPPMKTRLGSCTNGGPTDGHIRISSAIKTWPAWVVDYVIAHELAHRLHPDHSAAFWRTLTKAYPLTERARGFIKGMEFSGEIKLTEK